MKILKEELVPAMGCTEPVALSYGASKAREILGTMPDSVEVRVSYNIIKNVRSVVVPNTGGLKGIEAAVAAGIIAGVSDRLLQVISSVSEKQKADIRAFLDTVPVKVLPLEGEEVFDIVLFLYAGKDVVELHIEKYHTNIVYVKKNNRPVYVSPQAAREKNGAALNGQTADVIADKSLLNLADILDFADTCRIGDIQGIMSLQISCNMGIAEKGIRNSYGANVGRTLLKAYGNTVRTRACALAAAGSDARMSGCEMPVVINSGSGNQGIAVSVPVIVYAHELHVSDERLYRALAVSNLIAIHQKAGIGTLSAFCGAASAGCAAACGVAYVYGGGFEEISHTLVNSIVVISGIVCDGAKPSCAGKIAVSVEAGLLGYQMYMNGQEFKYKEGIVNRGVEETINNVSLLGKNGMRSTDKEIIRMMLAE